MEVMRDHSGSNDGGGPKSPEPGYLSPAQLIAADAQLELEEMVRQNPELAQYVTSYAIARAARALSTLEAMLKKILEDLKKF